MATWFGGNKDVSKEAFCVADQLRDKAQRVVCIVCAQMRPDGSQKRYDSLTPRLECCTALGWPPGEGGGT